VSLICFSVFLLRSLKNIPIIYARQGKVEQTTVLPIPLNPVGMTPIIFAIAFATFPYLIAQLIVKF
jgi:preprotein translocase subunit SecY